MKVLSVFNQKGGVGKTTTTINLAAAFALMLSHEAGRDDEPGRVLVIDLDEQMNSEITLAGGFFGSRMETGLGPYDNIAGLLTMDTPRPVTDIIRTANIPHGARHNMDFIPSSSERMSKVEAALSGDPVDGVYRLRGILETIEPFYEYVVIDNPPARNHVAINSLVGSTHVVIPCQLQAASIKGLTDTLKTIESVQRQHNPHLRLVGIIPSICNFQRAQELEYLDLLRSQYKDLILSPINDRADTDNASGEGLDIFSFKPSRKAGQLESANLATREFAQVATEVRQRLG